MAVYQPLRLLFVDLEKAYDSVPFTKLMESIRTLTILVIALLGH